MTFFVLFKQWERIGEIVYFITIKVIVTKVQTRTINNIHDIPWAENHSDETIYNVSRYKNITLTANNQTNVKL